MGRGREWVTLWRCTPSDYAPTYTVEVDGDRFVRLVRVRSLWPEYDDPSEPDLSGAHYAEYARELWERHLVGPYNLFYQVADDGDQMDKGEEGATS